MTEHRDDTARDWVAELQRWEDSGAHWRLLHRTADTATVAMLTCDGGEEVDRFTTADARLLDYLGDRHSSED